MKKKKIKMNLRIHQGYRCRDMKELKPDFRINLQINRRFIHAKEKRNLLCFLYNKVYVFLIPNTTFK